MLGEAEKPTLPVPRLGCSEDADSLVHITRGICISNRGAPALEGIREENRALLSSCFASDRSAFSKAMSSLHSRSCDTHDGMNIADMVPLIADTARTIASEAGKDGALLVLVNSAGKMMPNGDLAIQGTAGRWATLEALMTSLQANIGQGLAVLLISAIEVPAAHVQSGNRELVHVQSQPGGEKVDYARFGNVLALWALAPLGTFTTEHRWWDEAGTALTQVLSEKLITSGDSQPLVDILRQVSRTLVRHETGESPKLPAELERMLAAKLIRHGSHLHAGQGRRLSLGAIAQPSFHPLGNTLIDADGALIRRKAYQEFSVHTREAKVSMMSKTKGAEIWYTLDGSDPRDEGGSRRRFRKPVAMCFDGDGTHDIALRAVAVIEGLPPSRVALSPVFRLQGQVAPVTLREHRGDSGVMLSMECPTPGARIYYEDSGGFPNVTSRVYEEPIRLTTLIVRAFAVKKSQTDSVFSKFELLLQVALPKATFAGEQVLSSSLEEVPQAVFLDAIDLRIDCESEDAKGFKALYSLSRDDPEWSIKNRRYTAPFKVTEPGVYHAGFWAVAYGMADSPMGEGDFTIQNRCLPPSLSPANGVFTRSMEVHAATEQPEEEVILTLDGSQPSIDNPKAHRLPPTIAAFTPVLLDRFALEFAQRVGEVADPLEVTVKAISVRRGLVDSLVSTSSITLLDLVIPPAISPAPGPYSELVEVTFSCETPDATIVFTTDGSEPSSATPAPPPPISRTQSSATETSAPSRTSSSFSACVPPVPPVPLEAASLFGTHVAYPDMPLRITSVGATRVKARALRGGMAASNVTTSELSVFAQAVAWGCAKHCQLGAGEGQHALEDRVALAPMRVAGLEGHDLVSIYSGFRHTAFVTSKGKVLLSGVSLHGRLGHDQGDLLIPHSVKNLEGVRIHSVAAGQRHTVLLAVSGCVYTFGDGSQGQLGHGDNIGCSLPRLVATIRPGKHVEAMTGKVSHMMQVKAVAAGGYHSLVISTDDGLMTWGRGGEGQLGTDSRFSVNTPSKMFADATTGLYGRKVAAVSASDFHTAVVTSVGEVFATGRGSEGQLGMPDVEFNLIPCVVHALLEKDVFATDVACGRMHTMVLDNKGNVWAFGDPKHGVLGLGAEVLDKGAVSAPVKIAGLKKVLQLSCAVDATAARTVTGTLYTWGRGDRGQLGHADREDRFEPTQVASVEQLFVVEVAMSDASCTAIAVAGEGDKESPRKRRHRLAPDHRTFLDPSLIQDPSLVHDDPLPAAGAGEGTPDDALPVEVGEGATAGVKVGSTPTPPTAGAKGSVPPSPHGASVPPSPHAPPVARKGQKGREGISPSPSDAKGGGQIEASASAPKFRPPSLGDGRPSLSPSNAGSGGKGTPLPGGKVAKPAGTQPSTPKDVMVPARASSGTGVGNPSAMGPPLTPADIKNGLTRLAGGASRASFQPRDSPKNHARAPSPAPLPPAETPFISRRASLANAPPPRTPPPVKKKPLTSPHKGPPVQPSAKGAHATNYAYPHDRLREPFRAQSTSPAGARDRKEASDRQEAPSERPRPVSVQLQERELERERARKGGRTTGKAVSFAEDPGQGWAGAGDGV